MITNSSSNSAVFVYILYSPYVVYLLNFFCCLHPLKIAITNIVTFWHFVAKVFDFLERAVMCAVGSRVYFMVLHVRFFIMALF